MDCNRDRARKISRVSAQVHESINLYGMVPGFDSVLEDIARHCATAGAIAGKVVGQCKPQAFVFG